MSTRTLAALVLALAVPLAHADPAAAAVHFWDIAEIYSNEDGSVQFVELFTQSAFEPFTMNGKLVAGEPATNSVTLLGPVQGPTTNRSFLLATPGFADLPGSVEPDTVLPVAPFFALDGDSLIFRDVNDTQTFDAVTFFAGELPLDGVLSLHRVNPGGTSPADPPGGLFEEENSPTNYAGETGHLMLPEPATTLVELLALLALVLVARSRALRTATSRA